MKRVMLKVMFLLICTVFFCAMAENTKASSDAELAQKLSNPVADLITLPIQTTWDRDIGARDTGRKMQTNIQPVIPFEWNSETNLITRTIIPVIDQKNISPGSGSQFGIGDINMTLFFSPKKPTSGGLIWGVGPVFLLPTATDSQLGLDKWCVGPAAIMLTTSGQWTMGVLANHMWSIGGKSFRPDISTTFIQPFAAYTTPDAWTISLQSETTYNAKKGDWGVPFNVALAKLVKWGKMPVSLQGGVGYWLESPNSGAEGFRFRLQVNFVLPKP